jgi:hypothetical protein
LPANSFDEQKRYLWFSVEEKSAGDVIRMTKTYPSYKNFLSENNVQEGSEEDPMKMLEDVLLKEGESKMLDVICPFFAVVAKKKQEESD